jgi:hypothetical protein
MSHHKCTLRQRLITPQGHKYAAPSYWDEDRRSLVARLPDGEVARTHAAVRLGVQVRTEASVTPLGGSPMDCRSVHRYGLTRLAQPLRTGRWHFELFFRAWPDDQESHGFSLLPLWVINGSVRCLLKAPGGFLTSATTWSGAESSREDDDSVLVGDHGSARTDPHSADLDRLVNLAGAGLAALAWVCTQRLDANV